MINGKLKAAALVLLTLVTFDTIEWFKIDDGMLIGSIAYPDGAAVDITLNGSDLRFTAISDNGARQTVSMVICADEIDSAVVVANGRAVHLVIQSEPCGVEHYRYWIPSEIRNLREHQVFMPMIDN